MHTIPVLKRGARAMFERRLRILFGELTSLSRACVRNGIGLRLSLSAAWIRFVLGRLIGKGLRSWGSSNVLEFCFIIHL